jgi:hypothetical protein
MEFRIVIDTRTAIILLVGLSLISAIGLVVAYGTSNPSTLGHTWGEMECSECIQTSDIGNNQVTSAKAGFNYAGSTSKGGAASDLACTDCVSDSEISGIDWSTITSGMPAGFADGTDADTPTYPSCNFGGTLRVVSSECSAPCSGQRYTITFTCSSSRILSAQRGTVGDIGCGCGNCFVAGTKVTMADGTLKNIEDVREGDKVMSSDGTNTVLGIPSHEIGSGTLYSINSEVEVTGDHPFLSREGWKVIDVEYFYSLDRSLDEPVSKLEVGDILLTENGKESVESIEVVKTRQPDEVLYDLELDGDRTYIANGFVVHTDM